MRSDATRAILAATDGMTAKQFLHAVRCACTDIAITNERYQEFLAIHNGTTQLVDDVDGYGALEQILFRAEHEFADEADALIGQATKED